MPRKHTGNEHTEPATQDVPRRTETIKNPINYDGKPIKINGIEVLTTKKMTPENREYLKKAIPEMLAKN